eukprot:12816783-Heterocapsa_arctica.AAC.1
MDVASSTNGLDTRPKKKWNHTDKGTGETTPMRKRLWIRGLPQMIDIGRPLDVDESSEEVINEP